jgi:hypothetical protein
MRHLSTPHSHPISRRAAAEPQLGCGGPLFWQGLFGGAETEEDNPETRSLLKRSSHA